jgi:hypothetical protein
MEYHSAIMKNEIMSFAGKWMELEIIMLSEKSQVQKGKYHIPSLSCRLYNNNDINVKKTGSVGEGPAGRQGEKGGSDGMNMIKVHHMHV